MRAVASLVASLAAVLPLACVTAEVAPEERDIVAQKYEHQVRELTTSLWATKFFVETNRKLLSLQPPDEVEILDDTDGKPIVPGLAQEVIPAGTKVVIVHVGFASASANFTRELQTPRDRTWVDLSVFGKPDMPWYALVLRPDLKTASDVGSAIDKFLTDKPLDAEVATLPEADKKVISTKELAPGPSARALKLAFGPPLIKNININGATRLEDWTWKSDAIARTAHLRDGVVVSVEGPPVKHNPSVAAQ